MPRDLEQQATRAFRVDNELQEEFNQWIGYIDNNPDPADAPDLSAASLTTVMNAWRNHTIDLWGEVNTQMERLSDQADGGDLASVSASAKPVVDEVASKLNTLVTITDEADPNHPYPNPKNSLGVIQSNLLEGTNPNTGNSVNGGNITNQPASEVLRTLVANADTPAYDGNAAEDPIGDLIAFLGEEAPNLTAV